MMVAMADMVAYFAGGRAVTVQRESYAEPVAHPRGCQAPSAGASSGS